MIPKYLVLESINAKDNLRHIEEQTEQLAANWPDEINGYGHFPATVLEYLPYILLDSFSETPTSREWKFILATRLISRSIILFDKLMDDIASPSTNTKFALRIQAMQYDGYKLLNELFPPTASFWGLFRQKLSDYMIACISEKSYAIGEYTWAQFTEPVALDIAGGKSALAQLVAIGFSELTSAKEIAQSFCDSIHNYYIAVQMVDDIQDWRKDLELGQPSLLLSRIFPEWPPNERMDVLESLDELKLLRRNLYLGGHVSHALHLADAALEKAQDSVDKFSAKAWHYLLRDSRTLCNDWIKESHQIVNQCTQADTSSPDSHLKTMKN